MNCEIFQLKELVQCGDVEVERKIDEKTTQFIDRVEKHPNRKHQISLSFYEVKNKQATWFTNKVERHYWEHWYVNLSVAHHPKADSGKSHHPKVVNPGESASEERNAQRSGLESSLREVLFQIIKFGNEKDHIPSVPNIEGASFPFEITISSSSDSAFGMEMLKRMLQTGHPNMLS
ncbi:autophagy-related protein 101-like isoform X2 [Nicotiana tabacum]|uniref:Autophagy-related protein 101-like isoform X2 n=1 Tax=Nicotiana tabacum TaxID=4097 RepID=A0AC58T057_TOBAC|nr:autophagy-related protein 101-like isoform X2 [Nicotiana tomentosiformis]